MNFNTGTKDDEMSMEEILSSIRKYVSEESEKKKDNKSEEVQEIIEASHDDNVINLGVAQLAVNDAEPQQPKSTDDPKIYREKSTLSTSVIGEPSQSSQKPRKRSGPFDRLTNALNSYGKHKEDKSSINKTDQKTVNQLFTEIAEMAVKEWIESEMEPLVEKIITREIEKMKSE